MSIRKFLLSAVVALMSFSCMTAVNISAEEGLQNPDELLQMAHILMNL